MTPKILFFLLVSSFTSFAQNLKVEYDKEHDFSKYKTFHFGEGEIITPKDQRLFPDATVHKYVKDAMAEEMKEKGLQQLDSLADLEVSYVVGSIEKTDTEQLGPLGMTPGSTSQSWSRDYWQSSLIIDLNERSGKRVWRVNSTTSSSSTDAARAIGMVVAEGFKKFSLKPKKVKKKK
ncbi:MAG TPA: DUF4136 domain-containing protein [Cyclobacteriaceae bacterium]